MYFMLHLHINTLCIIMIKILIAHPPNHPHRQIQIYESSNYQRGPQTFSGGH